jgi:hypothetical protein
MARTPSLTISGSAGLAMPMALVVVQMADNAFVSEEAIQGVMLGTDQIGLAGSQPRGPT